jgi:hypothetical protein
MSKNASKSQVNKPDSVDTDFLLAEYDRLKGLIIENYNAQHRRFDFYLVAAAAITAGIISLQVSSLITTTVERMTYLLLTAWVIWGVVTFVNLTYMNVAEQHIVNAINDIQDFFFERNGELKKLFYFRSSKFRWAGLGIRGVILRGLSGGGVKATLAVINSIILAYFCFQFWTLSANATTRVIVTLFVFVLSGSLHAFYVMILYKVRPL